jgi:predicted O-linked N-acetylglucosamine transferase (SPINDLY family)
MSEQALFEQAKVCLEQGEYETVIALLEKCIEINADEIEYYWYLGLAYLLKEQEEEAQSIWISVFLQGTRVEIESWTKQLIQLLEKFLIQLLKQEKVPLVKVKSVLDNIRGLEEEYQNEDVNLLIKKCLKNLLEDGIELSRNRHFQDAETLFLHILSFKNNEHNVWYNLAVMYYQSGNWERGIYAIEQALSVEPREPNYLYLLGVFFESQYHLDNAIIAYQNAIEIAADFFDAYINLGNCYQKSANDTDAEIMYRRAIQINPTHCGAYVNLGRVLLLQKRYDEAVVIYEAARDKTQLIVQLYDNWVETLNKMGENQAAIQVGEEGLERFPDDLFLKRKVKLLLPIFHNSDEEIQYYRQRFTQGIDELNEELYVYNTLKMKNIMDYVWQDGISETNFYLAYQGQDDLSIQRKHGNFVEQIVHRIYPEYFQPLLISNLENRKIKIGYISQKMHTLLGKICSGWIKYHDKDVFEVYSYDLGTEKEQIVHQDFIENSDFHIKLQLNIETICSQIFKDKLDILILLDIGMSPIMTILATMRLAPVQCTTWSHPVTSGISNIDYFLSSDLMEPVNASAHYSEKLIRLPNLGIHYSKPPIADLPSQQCRKDYGLKDTNIVYLCCQHISKYLPQQDYIFAEIAQKVNNIKFIFIEGNEGSFAMSKLKRRIQSSFAEKIDDFEQYFQFLPRLDYQSYFNILKLADIFLDTFAWSGGVTSLDAIACGLPIVTCPGEFMRGRQSYGILKRLNITETIAKNESEYIKIAVKLGNDSMWREKIRNKIKSNNYQIYNDLLCITKLEEFYLQSVQSNFV